MSFKTLQDLPINSFFKQRLAQTISTLYPNQQKFCKSFYSKTNTNRNYLVLSETSAGKTLISTLFMLNYLTKEKTAIYLCPLKSITNEKEKFFRKICNPLYSVENLEHYADDFKVHVNIIVTTYEKFDSLLRKHASYIRDKVSCVVFDEIHWIESKSRGGIIDLCVSKLLNLQIPLIGLSATIGNGEEIAKWLNAILIESDFRPVPLTKGIFYNNQISLYENDEFKSIEKIYDSIFDVMYEKFSQKLGLIYFRMSRANVIKFAQKMYYKIKAKHPPRYTFDLPEIRSLDDKELNKMIKYGVAYHHAGLVSINKDFIETKFREKQILCLIATSTLAAGVNIPARYVIIDYMAYRDSEYKFVDKNEVSQMLGRAGRPGLDSKGIALLNIPSYEQKTNVEKIKKMYFQNKIDPIYSYLDLNDFSSIVLGIVASETEVEKQDIKNILIRTLAYHQAQIDSKLIDSKIQESFKTISSIKPSLFKMTPRLNLTCTWFGQKVSELYISPETIKFILNVIRSPELILDSKFLFLYFLYLYVQEMEPLYCTEEEKKNVDLFYFTYLDQIEVIEQKLNLKKRKDDRVHYAMKTARILMEPESKYKWCSFVNETRFYAHNNIQPGDMDRLVGFGSTLEWIFYCFEKIATYIQSSMIINFIKNLQIQLQYGIPGSLVDLCKIKHIGKKRAHLLYSKGIKTAEGILRNKEIVYQLFSRNTATQIFQNAEKEWKYSKK